MAVNINFTLLCGVILCSLVVGEQCFEGTCCLSLYCSALKMEVTGSSNVCVPAELKCSKTHLT